MPRPLTIPRSAWGAPPLSCPGAHSVNHATLHHGAGAVNSLASHGPDCYDTAYAYYDWHVTGHGWCDIGYHFMVCPHGAIFDGRDGDADNLAEGDDLGAHVGGCNTGNLGVCALGDYESPDPSPVTAGMLDNLVGAYAQIIAWKFDQNALDPLGSSTASCGYSFANISYHRAVAAAIGNPPTSCPGASLIPNEPPQAADPVARVRQRVCELISLCASPTSTAIPLSLEAAQVIPNPSLSPDPEFRLAFNIRPQTLSLKIFTLSGRRVGSWDETPMGAEIQKRLGLNLANGTYSYVLEAEGPGGDRQRVRGRFFVLR